MKEVQSPLLQLLMVLAAEAPLHISQGMAVLVSSTSAPQKSMYAVSLVCSSFSTCASTMGPPRSAK
jgi:hypothetical protein